MRRTFLILPVLSAPMPFQMALDERLFCEFQSLRLPDAVSAPWIRFYYASEPWISLGRSFQPRTSNVKSEHGIPVCRRSTGGGRVRHGKDLMFSLIAEKSWDETFKFVETSYLSFHVMVQSALKSLGKEAVFYAGEGPRGADCFTHPIATDLCFQGQKIAGGGQKRSAGMLLHQESIQPVPGLDFSALIPALERAFSDCFEAVAVRGDWHPEHLEAAASPRSNQDSAIVTPENQMPGLVSGLSCGELWR